ncbi:hypothetical protein [Paenibacillus sp. N3.4]|uniref:hypothetical protein n=1 Tax=Paenibacillus sp. N3.4 TaxID=2603222 RepID=UPI001650D46B|nr:hypothetical protein [Paenibacillus sp. N3.4]
MDVLFPLTTIVLVVLGAFCIFISIDNNRRTLPKRTDHMDNKPHIYSMTSTKKIEG